MSEEQPAPPPAPAETRAPAASRWRWGVALSAVLIVALVSAGAFFVLSGGGGMARSLTAGNAPAQTQLFVDFRTDLPGDQRQKLADFMAHFPGFADRAQFDNAFDELLNRITGRVSPDFTYTSAFKAWTSGEISIAVTKISIPTPSFLTTVNGLLGQVLSAVGLSKPEAPGPGPSNLRGVVIVSVKDRAAAEEWIDSQATRAGLAFNASSYAGTTLHQTSSGADPIAYAVTDRVLIAGSADVVRAALDAPKAGSLDAAADYQAAVKSMSGNGMAFFYANPRAIADSARIEAAQPILWLAGLAGVPMPSLPVWVAGIVRADSDRMTIQMTMPRTVAPGALSTGQTTLAGELPGSTVAVLEARSLGTLVSVLVDDAKRSESSPVATAANQAGQVIDLVGGIGWIGDSTLVVARRGSVYDSGLVVQTADEQTATDKREALAGLLSLVSLGGSAAPGLSLDASKETYRSQPIYRYAVSALGIPTVRFSISTRGSLVVLGLSDGFARLMTDVTQGSTLADQPGYRTALSDAGSTNAGFAYLDVPALEDEVGRVAFPGQEDYFRIDIKPYLDHVGSLAAAVIDGQTVVVRIVVTAR